MPDILQPGDVWYHKGMGRLCVTDEPTPSPGQLRCYWSMGGSPQGLATSFDPTNTRDMRLIYRDGKPV